MQSTQSQTLSWRTALQSSPTYTFIATGPEFVNTALSNFQAGDVSLRAKLHTDALLRLVHGPSSIPSSVDRSYVGPRLRACGLGGAWVAGNVSARHDRFVNPRRLARTGLATWLATSLALVGT